MIIMRGDHFGFDPGAFCLNKPIRHHHFQGHFTRLTRANCNFLVTVSLSMEFIFRIQGAIIYAISASNQSNNTIRIILFFQVGKY